MLMIFSPILHTNSSQVNNFMNLVMTKGWTGLAIEILQPSVLIPGYLRRHVLEARQYGPYTKSLPYFKALPNLLLFIFIGFMYVIIAPLMLPFLMIYFLIGYIVFRNQILNRYEPIYETGGQYWPHIHNRIIFCVFMMQVVGIGIFGVKHKPWLSSLSVPLLAVTLLFHYYCGLRFHPIFKEMSMQVGVSRDREDERNGFREEVLKKLRKAYLYPAFQSIETNEQIRSIHEPLLPG
ncbi:hypothetical protein KP509_1Z193300 [Ceratopteris richardii]|nr:hypothetical protein KP509_1Z193300 [Ceratopteris richardii]